MMHYMNLLPYSKSLTFKTLPLLVLSIASASAVAQAQSYIEEVTIVGSSERAQGITGSAHFVSTEQLRQFNYSDIQRMARQVPGVSIQIEDGYGLRPNISIRGVGTERSGRITLLEDNVLIAPAPYSAPSAYYFPTAGRMSAIEVLKGPSAITQGPYTIGGSLNLISTPIPQAMVGNLMTEVGDDNSLRVHATYGGQTDSGIGFLLETHQWQSEGFQQIDRSSRDTGLNVKDYMVKLSYAPNDSPHQIELKLQYADQDSNQSYLGLTDDDFSQDAYRRYGLSALDNIETAHDQAILRYRYEISDSLRFSATAYNNEHARNWFKTEGIDFDGSVNAEDFNRTSWANVVTAINTGSALEGLSPIQLQGILDGTADTAIGGVQVRANEREYFSRGVQFGLNWTAQFVRFSHDLELGLRIHEDEEDRLQRNSTYSQINGALLLADLGQLGNAGNRVQSADAVSLHIYDEIRYGNWLFTPGLRYEDIDQGRIRYSNGATRSFRDSRENQTQIWLPGMGLMYQFSDQFSVLAGAHKGFTAPTNSPGVEAEEAINYELGFRYQNDWLDSEVITFLSDYNNLLGVCTASSGSDCVIGDAFNGDAATVAGLEVVLNTDLASINSNFSIPLSFNYTYISGEFDTDIADTDFFGSVGKGDPIPYLPENQFLLSLGFEQGNWLAYLTANYVDQVCVRASCNEFQRTDDSLTLDLSANYQLNNKLVLFGRLENLTAEENILGRQPYGARPNKARIVSAGVRVNF